MDTKEMVEFLAWAIQALVDAAHPGASETARRCQAQLCLRLAMDRLAVPEKPEGV